MDFGFLVPVSFFILIGWIVKTISDNRTRRRALQNGNIKDSIKYLWEKSYALKPIQNIKWAIIFAGIGIVILLSHAFALTEAIAVGLSCLVAAGAFGYVYYLTKNKN